MGADVKSFQERIRAKKMSWIQKSEMNRTIGDTFSSRAESGQVHLGVMRVLLRSAVKDLEAGKTVVQSRSRSRETSGLHPKRPNSHESGYKNPSRRCLRREPAIHRPALRLHCHGQAAALRCSVEP